MIRLYANEDGGLTPHELLDTSDVIPIGNGGTGAADKINGFFNLLYKGRPPEDNLDNARANGIYLSRPEMSGGPPSGAPYGLMEVGSTGADGTGKWAYQQLHDVLKPGRLWHRVCREVSGSVWTEWYCLSGLDKPLRIVTGSINVTVAANATGDQAFTLSGFSGRPTVLLGLLTTGPHLRLASHIFDSDTQVHVYVRNDTSTAATSTVTYTAIGIAA